MSARYLAWIGSLALLGCKPEPDVCLAARALELDGVVLTTGLVVDGEIVSLLRDDGTLEPLATLPQQDDPRALFAHDPATNKLWWVDGYPFFEPPQTWVLHQFDLASEAEDWQRELVYPDHEIFRIDTMLHHEGGLFLGGSLVSLVETDEFGSPVPLSLLARYDSDGTERWTQIGQPAFEFDGHESVALESIDDLSGVTDGISFRGAVVYLDSAALTLATADLETGELRWSTGLVNDDFSSIGIAHGHDDLLVQASGPRSYHAEARALDIVATTALGEPRWQLDYTWGILGSLRIDQLVLEDRVIHMATELDTDPRARVLVQDHDGEVLCESDMPELIDFGAASWVSVTAVRAELIVVQVSESDRSAAWLLRP